MFMNYLGVVRNARAGRVALLSNKSTVCPNEQIDY